MSAGVVAMKDCPACGASVQASAELCFCYHRFEDADGLGAVPRAIGDATLAPSVPTPTVAASEVQLAGDAVVGEPRAQPEGAVRARLNAAIADQILLGVGARALVALTGSRATVLDAVGFYLLVQFAYFAAQELRDGTTVGKRAFHVHVVDVSGAPAGVRQIVVRNLLRPFDALPAFYASGLLTLMRTGRSRRQRIGDVAARTTVVLDGDARAPRTPRWLLPAAALLATVLSLALIVPALDRPGHVAVSGGVYVHVGGEPARGLVREAH